MDNPEGSPVLRIGELSRRLGVSDHVLRAWESRYGLLRPVRSAGGFRLYSEADAGRVRRMQAHLAHGLSAAEAAKGGARGGRPGTAGPGRPVPAAAAANGESGTAPRVRRGLRTPRPSRVRRPVLSGRPWTPLTSRPRRQSWTGFVRSIRGRGAAHRRAALSHRARKALGAGNGQRRPGALREQRHPRAAGRAGQGLGDRTRSPRGPGLPSRGTSRPGADGVRHRAQPQRVADRLPRDEHAGGGAGADGRRDAPGPRRPGRRPYRRTSTASSRSSRRSPGALHWPWPGPAPHRNSRRP